jgi:hypothetical protein
LPAQAKSIRQPSPPLFLLSFTGYDWSLFFFFFFLFFVFQSSQQPKTSPDFAYTLKSNDVKRVPPSISPPRFYTNTALASRPNKVYLRRNGGGIKCMYVFASS